MGIMTKFSYFLSPHLLAQLKCNNLPLPVMLQYMLGYESSHQTDCDHQIAKESNKSCHLRCPYSISILAYEHLEYKLQSDRELLLKFIYKLLQLPHGLQWLFHIHK